MTTINTNNNNRQQSVILYSKTQESILKVTNDFIMSNILPKYNIIKITTTFDEKEDMYKSEVIYSYSYSHSKD